MVPIKDIFKPSIPKDIQTFTLIWRRVHNKKKFPLRYNARTNALYFRLTDEVTKRLTPFTIKVWLSNYSYLIPKLEETFNESMLEMI